MNLNNDYIKKKISLNERELDKKDIYINVFLTKTYEIYEYVDVQKDENIYKIDKQFINPYYINFGFFESVNRIKINNENDLTQDMISYLNATYTDSINNTIYQGDVVKWFNEIGYNELINDVKIHIDKVTGKKTQENGLDRLEKNDPNMNSVVSKSFYFPIDINK